MLRPNNAEAEDARRHTQECIRSCRHKQLRELRILYNQHLPSPPVAIAYGLEHVLETITNFFNNPPLLDHAVVRGSECLSQRHLLSKIFGSCIRATEQQNDIDRYDRLDSVNALVVNLQKLFEKRTGKFILVIADVDKQRGASHTLLPSLARLGDVVPCLSVILTATSPRSLQLHRQGIPYIHFPPYSRSEAIHMATVLQPALKPDDINVAESTLSSIYKDFVAAVYDTLTIHTSSTSIPAFQRTCEKLWPRFIWPLLSNEALSVPRLTNGKTAPQWDFARLIVRNRALFQAQGETALTAKLLANSSDSWTFAALIQKREQQQQQQQQHHNQDQSTSKPSDLQTSSSSTPLLKFFPTLLLLSCYLASHTPSKHDIILFSRLSSSSSHKRKYLSSALNKNRVRKTPTKPRASSSSTHNTPSSAGRTQEADIDDTPSKKRSKAVSISLAAAEMTPANITGKEKTHKSTRLQFEKTSSIPRPFPLERVIAIVRAAHPDGLSRVQGAADRIYGEMAELERLRMVVRLGTGANAGAGASAISSMSTGTSLPVSAGGVGIGVDGGGGTTTKGSDDGILEEKWRINVGRESIVEMGKPYGLSLEGWEID